MRTISKGRFTVAHIRNELDFPETATKTDVETWLGEKFAQATGADTPYPSERLEWRDGETFDSLDAAKAAIEDTSDRDVAVRYRDTQHAMTKTAENARDHVERLTATKDAYVEAHHVWLRKNGSLTCPGCGSRLSTQYLRQDDCPLCGRDLRSATVREHTQNLDERIGKATAEADAAVARAAKRAPVLIHVLQDIAVDE